MEQNLFEIVYDQATVRCNDFLSGHFNINSKVADIHSVKFQFWELSKCKWTKSKNFVFNRDKTFIGAKETLHVETLLTFWEDLPNLKRYYFRVKIPHNLPSTWEGIRGYIKYYVKILVDFQGQHKTFENELFVQPYRDLKLEKHLLNEIREDSNHVFTLLNLGSVDISIWSPISGIARGQSLPVLCTITNQSNSIFTTIIILLKMNEIYISTSPVNNKQVDSFDLLINKRRTMISYGMYEYYCLLKTEKHWHPTTQCPKDSCCEVTYDLKVKLLASSQDTQDQLNLESDSVPIIIGTEPLFEWDPEKITNELTKESLNKKLIENDYKFENESEICIDTELNT